MSRLAVTRRLLGRHRRRLTAMAISSALALTGLVSLAVPAHAGTADRMVYVTNVLSGSVSAIDTTTDTVVRDHPGRRRPHRGSRLPRRLHRLRHQ